MKVAYQYPTLILSSIPHPAKPILDSCLYDWALLPHGQVLHFLIVSNIHLARLQRLTLLQKTSWQKRWTTKMEWFSFVLKAVQLAFMNWPLTIDQSLISYGIDWEKVSSLCINNDKLYAAHQKGVEEVSLVNLGTVRVSSAGGEEWLMPHTLAPYGDGTVVSDPEKHCALKWSSSIRNVLESVRWWQHPWKQWWHSDKIQIFQPSGTCTEFKNVVYICDTQTSCIN